VVLLITVAMMLPLAWFATDFAQLVFGRGAMEPEDVEVVGGLMALGVLALPLQGVASMLTATYNAARDTAYILWLNILTVLLFGLSGYLSMRQFGLSALMVSLVVVNGVLVVLQLQALQRRLYLGIGALLWQKRLARSLLLMLLAGSGLLQLLQWLQLEILMNVAAAVLVGACMLLIGIFSAGSHRTLLAMMSSRCMR
jgi:peptidoglycan biosynthesis protein MviN/MurJ (putative lipid II flippase)